MNAFDYAMKMEQDGKTYYQEQAEKMTDMALRSIFVELAADEELHYQVFKDMAAGKAADYQAAFKTKILSTTKNIFQKLSQSKKHIDTYPAGVKEAWVKARELEQKAEEFYREQAGEAPDAAQKTIWSRIADEERKHWVAMDNIVGFIDRPNQWLEDAEWSNLESY